MAKGLLAPRSAAAAVAWVPRLFRILTFTLSGEKDRMPLMSICNMGE